MLPRDAAEHRRAPLKSTTFVFVPFFFMMRGRIAEPSPCRNICFPG
jgi:hypothetical protein